MRGNERVHVIINVIFLQQKEIKMNERGLPHFLSPAGFFRSDERWTQRNWKKQQQQQSCLKKLIADSLPEEGTMFLGLVGDGGHHPALWPLQCAWWGPERLRDSSGSAPMCWLSCSKNLIMDPSCWREHVSTCACERVCAYVCVRMSLRLREMWVRWPYNVPTLSMLLL